MESFRELDLWATLNVIMGDDISYAHHLSTKETPYGFKVSTYHALMIAVFLPALQLWTIYCETFAVFSTPGSETHVQAHATIMDFWGRVTPGVLQLLSHSKVVSDSCF